MPKPQVTVFTPYRAKDGALVLAQRNPWDPREMWLEGPGYEGAKMLVEDFEQEFTLDETRLPPTPKDDE